MPDGTTATEVVLGALERTVGRGSARIEFRFDAKFEDAFTSGPGPSPLHGDLKGRLLWRMLRWVLPRLVTHITKEPSTGVVDFQAHRCVFGSSRPTWNSDLIIGNRHWSGSPGTTLAGLHDKPATTSQPLWLVDLLRGVVDAREQAVEDIDGRSARRFLAHADLDHASAAASYTLAVPDDAEKHTDDGHVAVDVWIDDDGHIRRIRHARLAEPHASFTVDLTDFGAALPSDWSRLPA
jgi:hypothetical protein